jgi:hypothetical protein
MASSIKRELGLSKSSDLEALVACEMPRDRYIELAKG